MDETTLKLVSIQIGDEITYITANGKRNRREVEGWNTALDGKAKFLMLAGDVQCRLDTAVSRRRVSGCGQGYIKFKPTQLAG